MKEYITSEHVLSNLANLPQLVFEGTIRRTDES